MRVTALKFDGIGLDFIEGRKTSELVKTNGFPSDKILFAGLVNGKNIWRNNYAKTLDALKELKSLSVQMLYLVHPAHFYMFHILLKVRLSLQMTILKHFAFAEEKLV